MIDMPHGVMIENNRAETGCSRQGAHHNGCAVWQLQARHWDIQGAEDGGEERHVILSHQRHELPLQGTTFESGIAAVYSMYKYCGAK